MACKIFKTENFADFFCPKTVVTPLWGNIMKIYGHWDLQNSNLGSQKARKAKHPFSVDQN